MQEKINWGTAPFFVITPLAAIFGTLYVVLSHGLHWATLALTLFYVLATGLSITAGYHRLFSHVAYKAAWPVRLFYVLFGAGAFEGSVLEWCTDHRDHHRYTDQDKDPYNVKRGLLWSHIGWIFYLDPSRRNFKNIEDLNQDPMLLWQNKHYKLIATFMGFLLPMGLAACWGDPWGGLFIAGALRMTLNHHFTFFINSFAHYFGRKTYSDLSARDNWMLSLVTYGEGYHNFHHQFAIDYRNGVRWFDFDPSKWLIWTLSKLGLASGLKQIDEEIIAKARMQMEEQRLITSKGVSPECLEEMAGPIREKLQQLHLQLLKLRKEYAHSNLEAYKIQIQDCQRQFKQTLKDWAYTKKLLLASKETLNT
jgi:stearoyl-CoA desaturase (delta-9 desaturase)